MKSILDVSLYYHKSGAMKRLLFIVLSAALLGACKKDASSPKNILLSKTFVDGKIETECIYNSDGQLKEEKNYWEKLGTWQLGNRAVYAYDANGRLKEKVSYDMPSNTLSSHYVFTVNDLGNITRIAIYNASDSGKLSFYIDHEYNSDGSVKQQTWKDEDEKIQTYRVLNYYPNGNMRTSESYYQWGGPTAEKVWGSSYGPSDTTLPASFYSVKAYPVNFYYSYLTSSYINHFLFDNGAVDEQTQEVMSDRKFNKHGLVTEVKVTTKHIKPVKTDEVRTLKFEYVEL
jgi:hypothetical protein